jgi:hypothetical protein
MSFDPGRPPLENIAEALFAIAEAIDGHTYAVDRITESIEMHGELLAGTGVDGVPFGAIRELADQVRSLPDSLGHELVLGVLALKDRAAVDLDASSIASSLDDVATAIRDHGEAPSNS